LLALTFKNGAFPLQDSFLPTCPEGESDIFDIVLISGDAYVDHPSFGVALIGRYLESLGYRVGIIAQPEWESAEPFKRFGRPRLFFGVSAGNVDSMVANYTPDRRKREEDDYTPGGGKPGRPDHASIVYAQRLKEAYPDVPVVLGGIEASLRRVSHYDFVQQKIRGSVLADAKADFLIYSMGERAIRELADGIACGATLEELRNIRGLAYLAGEPPVAALILPAHEEVRDDPAAFREFFKELYEASLKPEPPVIAQKVATRFVVINPPARPLSPEELDALYHMPFTRKVHPDHEACGGVKAIETVKNSIVTHRGCYGGCSFCAITVHQGKGIISRPREGVIKELTNLAKTEDFKGTVQDIGGPTANMYGTGCKAAKEPGGVGCGRPSCIYPDLCPSLELSGAPYLDLLRAARRVRGVKHVYVASGLRHDMLVMPTQKRLFRELVEYHVGGRMKIAPEHIAAKPLRLMAKPPFRVFKEFRQDFENLRREAGKELYYIPYFIVGHPGCSLEDALDLAHFVGRTGRYVEQVQQFTPTPMTASTCMYFTRLDLDTGEDIYVPSGSEAKVQKSLLQLNNPRAKEKVIAFFARRGESEVLEELPGFKRAKGAYGGAAKRGKSPFQARRPKKRSPHKRKR